nr:basic leucine zipper transcriptional factor ATF-like 3 isoform X2 [Gorilla gorilla gorilla]
MSQGLPAAGSVLQRSVAAPGNQPQPQSPEDDDRKVRRREKNRVAAQRSRKKQTQKADKLHELMERTILLITQIRSLGFILSHSFSLRPHAYTCIILQLGRGAAPYQELALKASKDLSEEWATIPCSCLCRGWCA